MATSRSNLYIQWGLYLVHRYYDGKHKLVKTDNERLIETIGVNRIDLPKLQRGIDALWPPNSELGRKVELHVKISNVW